MVCDTQQAQDIPKESATVNKLIVTESISDESSEAGWTKVDWQKVAVTMFPSFESVYTVELKPMMGALKDKTERISILYDIIERHSTKIRMVHGLSLMLFGGSWVSLAMFISFWAVHDIDRTLRDLKDFGKGDNMETMLNSLHQFWVLALIWYAIWNVHLLSVVTIAFMLEKYITGTIVNPAIMTQLEERLPLLKMFGRWSPFIIRVSIRISLIVLSSFSYHFQACLVMGCVGYDRLYSSLPIGLRKQIYELEGPFKLDGKAATLLAFVIVCSVWQCWNGYEFSLFGIVVLFGFLVREAKIKSN